MNDIFKMKNIGKVRGRRYIVFSLLSIFVCGSIVPSLLCAFIINHFHLHPHYSWVFSLFWGGFYGWLEPVRRYHDAKFDRLYKKFKDEDIFKSLSPKNSLSYFSMPRIFVELLTYRKIKPSDLIAVDTTHHYADERFRQIDYFNDQLSNAIDTAGIMPKLVLKSNIYPKNDYAVFFENQEDYNLVKLSVGDDHNIIFLNGKDLLDYANRN